MLDKLSFINCKFECYINDIISNKEFRFIVLHLYLQTHFSAQEWAKSMIRISCMTMKQNPPIIPKTIQVDANDPSGMKKAPMIPPITNRYFIPQKLKMTSKILIETHSDFGLTD